VRFAAVETLVMTLKEELQGLTRWATPEGLLFVNPKRLPGRGQVALVSLY
jgi:hypothetical protein